MSRECQLCRDRWRGRVLRHDLALSVCSAGHGNVCAVSSRRSHMRRRTSPSGFFSKFGPLNCTGRARQLSIYHGPRGRSETRPFGTSREIESARTRARVNARIRDLARRAGDLCSRATVHGPTERSFSDSIRINDGPAPTPAFIYTIRREDRAITIDFSPRSPRFVGASFLARGIPDRY